MTDREQDLHDLIQRAHGQLQAQITALKKELDELRERVGQIEAAKDKGGAV